MLEASVMAQFDHPNVVKMEGVITKSIYLWICFPSSSCGGCIFVQSTSYDFLSLTYSFFCSKTLHDCT